MAIEGSSVLPDRIPVVNAAVDAADTPNQLRRILGMKDLVLMIIGTVVGSGIFLVPGAVLRNVGNSVPMALGVWLAGGVLSLLVVFGVPDEHRVLGLGVTRLERTEQPFDRQAVLAAHPIQDGEVELRRGIVRTRGERGQR